MKVFIKNTVFPLCMIMLGAACAAFSIECFLVPNTILDGGITGISLMLSYATKIPLSIFIIAINIPFFVVGYRHLGKTFLIRAVWAMGIFAASLLFFEKIKTVTESELLAVVYGGVLLGTGVGLVLRYGGCLDGTEIVAMLLSKKYGISTGAFIFIFNIVIYSTAGLLFGWDRAMLSLLTYFLSYKMIDVVEEALEQAKASMIITDNATEISDKIYKRLGRTCTKISAEGKVSGSSKVVLYCVITRVEVSELKRIINETEGSSFVTISEVSEIIGNHIKSSEMKLPDRQK
ncbi:MAG: YitT family protein [Oscillospiraceae bacterium]|nr:YitT family protein [Oscillospiraceae bacterium]